MNRPYRVTWSETELIRLILFSLIFGMKENLVDKLIQTVKGM